MKNKKEISTFELILERYEDAVFLKADGLDDAVIGIDEKEYRLIYSIEKCINILAKNMKVTKKDLDDSEIKDGVTINDKKYELASEFFFFNTLGAYMTMEVDGETINGPIFTYTDFS